MNDRRKAGFGTFVRALGAGLQWRLLLIWLLLMLIPAAVAAWPMSAALGSLLDTSVHAGDWATSWDALGMSDVFIQLSDWMPAIGAAGMAAGLLTLLLAPFLTGMVVASAREGRSLGLGELMHGGLAEYWRMLRVLLWSLLSWAVALGIGAGLMHAADSHAKHAVLQSSVDMWNHAAFIVTVLLALIAHAIAEASRAQFAADRNLSSATRAYGRGIGMVFRRPLATFGMYLGVSVVGYALVMLFGMLRIRATPAGFFGILLAFVLAQLIVLSLAWMRTSRLYALSGVAGARRRGSSLPPSSSI